MQSANEDVVDLAHALRQESLLISNERTCIEQLTDLVDKNEKNVFELAWICARQRQNLSNLIISRPEAGPSACSRRAMLLENAKFIDIYKSSIRHQHVGDYIKLLVFLHQSPCLLAQCLTIAERINQIIPSQIDSVVQIISDGLYGSSIHTKDIEMTLKLLQELVEIQLAGHETPRRMLRSASSAFSRLYHRFHESFLSAKLFLTAVLHEPVMALLVHDDQMLDLDTIRMLMGFSTKEKLKRFGIEGTAEYEDNLRRYRQYIIDTLHNLVTLFIKSLATNWILFPSTLRWLIQRMCFVMKQSNASEKDVNSTLTDMIFTHFICPALVSPDLYGISDAPVSECARFNLIQIGQILQMLALIKYQEIDPKLIPLFERLDQNVIANLLEQLIPNDYDAYDNQHDLSMFTMGPHQNSIQRGSVLMTQSELNLLVDFLRTVLENDGLMISGEDRRKLGSFLDRLPDKLEMMINGDLANGPQINLESVSKIKLISLGKNTRSKLAKTISLNISSSSASNIGQSEIEDSKGNDIGATNFINGNLYLSQSSTDYEQVLVIPITIGARSEFKILSEDEVLNLNKEQSVEQEPTLTEKNVEELSLRSKGSEILDGVVNSRVHRDKHKRFSLTRDDGSIGNTSDNLEAVSEAPSNHSVTSSLDLEENDQNDNLSDMVSANVSGRGSPNISGRDTPSSQVTESGNNQIPAPQMAKMLNKARSDIEDKFCKFEIKKLIEGDETVSIISDTWSTDVLASDSETIEANDRNFSTPLIPTSVILPGDHNYDPLAGALCAQMRSNNLDETQSESAWSTDVLASDSEKMTEIDTDDNQSIAAKSDTTDSAVVREPGNGVVRTPDSPFFSPRVPNNLNTVSSRTPESPYSNRSYDESPREDFSRTIRSACEANPSGGVARNTSTFDRAYLTNSNIPALRQNSSESYGSSQSLEHEKNNSPSRALLDRREKFDEPISATPFGAKQADSGELLEDKLICLEIESKVEEHNIIKSNPNILNPFFEDSNKDNGCEMIVEHRRLSAEQRNANFDSRRNGVINLTDRFDDGENPHHLQLIESAATVRSESLIVIDDESQGDAKSTENDTTPRKHTGAIPKSISFDSSADKTRRGGGSLNKGNDSLKVNGSGFLNKLKQGFKNRRVAKVRYSNDENSDMLTINHIEPPNHHFEVTSSLGVNETTEDILAKYRRKVSTSSDPATSDSTGSNNSSSLKSKSTQSDVEQKLANVLMETETSFDNAKRKLRVVLASIDLHTSDFRQNCCLSRSPLRTFLQIQIAQAICNQNLQQVSYASEALRCLNSLDLVSQRKLTAQLMQDMLERQRYIQYLIKCRQFLLSAIENINKLEQRLKDDKRLCNKHLVLVCVKMFVEKHEEMMTTFHDEFAQLTISDEKLELLEEFMHALIENMRRDGILAEIIDNQRDEVEACIERMLVQRVYKQLMFPNDEADISRDMVLNEHIRKLAQVVTPNHRSLKIPDRYLNEAPWSFAQQQISYISAYKTAREKVQCVVKAVTSIMNLLVIASPNTVPSADDLTPVLIYVIIKANPPFLLSTIQFVDTFIADKLEGETKYWWIQFASAIEFIKTMEYNE